MIQLFFAFMRLKYGQVYISKNLNKAITIFELGVQKYPQYSFLFLHLGLAYGKQQDWEKSIHYLEKARFLDRSNPVFDLFLAKMYIDAKKYQLAVEILEESIKKDKHNQLSWGYLSLAYLCQEDYENFRKIATTTKISENSELQIRIILTLEQQIRNRDENEI